MVKTTTQTICRFLPLLALLLLFFASQTALAGPGEGGGLEYESWFARLRASATGPVAYTFGIIGIIVAGANLIMGGDFTMFFRALIFLVFVMSLLVAAGSVMSDLFGTSACLPETLVTNPAAILTPSITGGGW
jgi:type IV secretion system protein VirB2